MDDTDKRITNYSKLLPNLSHTVVPPNLNVTKDDIDAWSRKIDQFKSKIDNEVETENAVTNYEKWIKDQSTRYKAENLYVFTKATGYSKKGTITRPGQTMRYRSRLKQILAGCLFITVALALFYRKSIFLKAPKVKPSDKFDLIKNRNNFKNQIYTLWGAVPSKAQRFMNLPMQEKCDLYFKNAKPMEFDLSFWNDFKADPHVYKRKKWIRDRTREEKRKYKTSEWKDEYDKSIAQEFGNVAKVYSGLEKKMFDELGHMKVFGKCYASDANASGNCENVQQNLYPWLSNQLPSVTNAEGEVALKLKDTHGCVTQSLVASQGKGIVIPTKSKQVENVCRLLNSLIALENKLPIEIAHLSLSEHDKASIVAASRNSTSFAQKISFVDLKSVLNVDKFAFLRSKEDELFLYTLSLIFNSFSEVVLLSANAIPLSNLEILFQNGRYKSSGRFFFRSRPHLDREKFNPGFHEITSLVKHHLQPNADEIKFFNMTNSDSSMATSRFYKDSFRNIIDESVIVMNKVKNLSGLLITINLQFYNVLKIRLTRKSMFDLIWIGQEISGQEVIFNNNYPVMAGIYTPDQNLPRDAQTTNEICSASFAQLSEIDDISLLYITSDQLQNWLKYSNSMKSIFEQKYSTKYTEMVDNLFDPTDPNKTEMKRVDYTEVQKVLRNPLAIEHIIKPPTLTSIVYVHHFEEPNEAWVEQTKLISERMRHGSKKYYCAYDTVGNPMEEGVRGLTINVDDDLTKCKVEKTFLSVYSNTVSEKQVVGSKRLPSLKKSTLKRNRPSGDTKPSALVIMKQAEIRQLQLQYDKTIQEAPKFDTVVTVSSPTIPPPVSVLISNQADMFNNFRFLTHINFFIGPYKIIKMITPNLYDVEVGLSTSYNTIFPHTVLKPYPPSSTSHYAQEPPQTAYMLKYFAKQNLISAIVGWNAHDKLIAMAFKCCHPSHCVVFDVVEAASAIESVSTNLFTQLAIEYNDASKREKNKWGRN
ncbi:hypothetical protein CANMA_002495 [Candida margitis]|uniref:uncharacterized protein n=1 Tax=Candida margitis TaxID=1775924 RepID=UPI002225D3CB|nr:uncharacterized protein CANMA_002495 [Candida margitis]KAI5968279.1 hypothetical protein CANMA_002495 [Candida margitis]